MLTTLATFKKNWLKIEAMNTDNDASITEAITEAGIIIEGICDQPLESSASNLTIYFSGLPDSGRSLSDQLLGALGFSTKRIYYTVPLTLVSLYYRTLPSDSWTAITGGVLFQSNLINELYLSTGFPYNYYKCVLTAGYTTIPSDLASACSELALEIYSGMRVEGGSRLGVSSTSISQGGVTTTTSYESVLEKIDPVISKYKRRLV